jgi:hypothetical protein
MMCMVYCEFDYLRMILRWRRGVVDDAKAVNQGRGRKDGVGREGCAPQMTLWNLYS